MKVEVLFVPGCPNYRAAMEQVHKVLASESLQAEFARVPVSSAAQAELLRFPGSPTIRVNGEDVEPGAVAHFGLSCRLYPNQGGIPSEDALRAAILRAKEKTA
jgi:hypothetical protein